MNLWCAPVILRACTYAYIFAVCTYNIGMIRYGGFQSMGYPIDHPISSFFVWIFNEINQTPAVKTGARAQTVSFVAKGPGQGFF